LFDCFQIAWERVPFGSPGSDGGEGEGGDATEKDVELGASTTSHISEATNRRQNVPVGGKLFSPSSLLVLPSFSSSILFSTSLSRF
jgi:hypothetical protein